jgi:hypothetical protein
MAYKKSVVNYPYTQATEKSPMGQLLHILSKLNHLSKAHHYSGINTFNNLPLEIKNVAGNQKKFKTALKQFLYTCYFYIAQSL